MLQISHPNYEQIYEALSIEDILLKDFEDDSRLRIIKEVTSSFLARGLTLGPVELESPLSHLSIEFFRKGNLYIVSSHIFARDERVFRGLSDDFEKVIFQRGVRFKKTSKDLTGHLYKIGEKFPFVSITNFEKTRSFSNGEYGAKPPQIKDAEDFQIECGTMVNIINIVLNITYKRSNGPFLDLYLN